MHYLLLYDYVPDILERRGAYRPAHLELVRAYADRGAITAAGALDEPLDGAAIAFEAGREDVEAFVRDDPYVKAGLVTAWRIRRWNLVTGAPPA